MSVDLFVYQWLWQRINWLDPPIQKEDFETGKSPEVCRLVKTKEMCKLSRTHKDRQMFLAEKIVCSAKMKKAVQEQDAGNLLDSSDSSFNRLWQDFNNFPKSWSQWGWMVKLWTESCDMCCIFHSCYYWQESNMFWACKWFKVGTRHPKQQQLTLWEKSFFSVSFKVILNQTPFSHCLLPLIWAVVTCEYVRPNYCFFSESKLLLVMSLLKKWLV